MNSARRTGGKVAIGFFIGVAVAAVLTLGPWLVARQGAGEVRFVDRSKLVVPVYLSSTGQTARYTLETYVRGVLAAEMPAQFEPEALKAQAMASRTFIVRRMQQRLAAASAQTGLRTAALVTDTVADQAFLTDAQLRRIWGNAEYRRRMPRIEQAVMATAGQIITYHGEPIDAAFFSTSNGRTEDADAYWTNPVPYLRSVASPWDKNISPKYTHTRTITQQQLAQKLNLTQTDLSLFHLRPYATSHTAGGRIAQIRLGTKTFSGREIREKLQLASADFTLKWTRAGKIKVTARGYGHGIGMSQYGAQGMALAGYSAEQIVKHYYTGVAVEKM
jgi:stage II sporulation protein D